MTIEDRLRDTTALDRSVQEVDVAQRLEQLMGRQRRQARTAMVVPAMVLLVAVGALAVGLVIARQPNEGTVGPTPRPLGKVVAIVPLPALPLGVGFGDGSVWAVMAGPDNNSPGTVARIDPRSNRVVATTTVGSFPVRAGSGAGGVWVTNNLDSTVSRIDPATNKVVDTIKVGAPSADYRGLAAGPEGVFVLNGDNTVSRIDPATGKVVATIAVPNCCDGEIVLGLGEVWLSNGQDGTVSRIDLATNEVAATIRVGAQSPFGVGVVDGAVWVTSAADSTVFRIDPATNTVVAPINVTGGNHSLTAGAGAVWVQGLDKNVVTKIDPNR